MRQLAIAKRCLCAGMTSGKQGEQKVGHDREVALRIRKAAKKLLYQDLQDYLKEHGAEILLKINTEGTFVSSFLPLPP